MTSFENALVAVKKGKHVYRMEWRKDSFIFLVKPIEFQYKDPVDPIIEFAEVLPECLAIHTSDGNLQLGWVPSQEDMLRNDWIIK